MLLACLMVMSMLAVTLSAADSDVCSVTKKDGTVVGTYAKYEDALKAAYEAGGGTITFVADYTLAGATNVNTDAATVTDITINGGGHTLECGSITPFNFAANDNVTVNDLKVNTTGARFTDIYAGSTITFNKVTFTSNAHIDDQYGYFRTPNTNSANDKVNTLNFKDCTITLTGKGTVIGIRNGAHILDVNMEGTTVIGSTQGNMPGFIYGGRNATLKDTDVAVSGRVFWGMKGGTIRVDGNSTLKTTSGSRAIFDIAGSYNVYLGDNTKIVGKVLNTVGGAAEYLNIYATNPDFFYTDDTTQNTSFPAPVMNDGATLRVSDDEPNYGLRFTSTCAPTADTETVKGVKYGTVITKDTYLDKALWAEAVTGNAKDGDKEIFKSVWADKGLTKAADGTVTMNTALANIKEENYKSTFYARSFAEYSLDSLDFVKVYVFSELDTAKHGASYSETVNKDLSENVKDASADGYTTVVDSYVTYANNAYAWQSGTKYTCYSSKQYADLKAIATK